MTIPMDPAINQPAKRVQMLHDLELWAKYIPDWAWWSLAKLRPIVKRGGAMQPDEEETFFKVWKSTNYYKSKGIVPTSEDKPFKPKPKPPFKEFYV